MTSLVTGDGNTLDILFNGCLHNFFYAAVVAEVNDLCALTLHNAAHNVYGGIVTIKKTCCSNDTDCILGLITHCLQSLHKNNPIAAFLCRSGKQNQNDQKLIHLPKH